MNDPRQVLTRPGPPPELTMRYGEAPDQVIDLWLPTRSAPAPLVVFLHGGFWRAAYDRRHTYSLAADLASRGYAAASVEYRRTGQQGGGWPGTFDDVAHAVDAAPRLAAVHAPGQVDERRWALAGHSAGGHLALWAAARHRLPDSCAWRRPYPETLRGVLALAPVCDLVAAYARGLGEAATVALMGGGPEQVSDRYRLGDPRRLLPSGVRTTVVHGELDLQVPIDLSRHHVAAAHAAGDPITLLEQAEAEHFALIEPRSGAWPAVISALGDLLPAAAPAEADGPQGPR
ncbi:MAG: alpha/beta hydrolase family protein [Micromonosporaceae bacterium]